MKYNFNITILDKYIIKKFIGTYFFAILLIIGIVIIFDISEKIDDFVDKEAPLKAIIFNYYSNFIPYFMNMFSPMFVFISVIFFTSKLAANSEIVAILAGGISFKRIMYPYLISAAVIAAFSLLLNLFVIPPANKGRLAFEEKYIKKKYENTGRNLHYQISPGTFMYVESFSTWNNTAYKFTLESIEGNTITSKLSAETAAWDSTKGCWKLNNYHLRKYVGNSESITTGKTLDTTIAITVSDFYRKKKMVEQLNYPQLNNMIETQKMRGDQMVKYALIEKHTRFALPFSAFILTIIGVSLSSQKRRGGIGMNIGIGIALSFSYILFLRFSQMFVHTGALPPGFALWLPNLLYAMIAFFLYRIAPK
ncbi:MAG: LptF/LptG family permease [Bacteroidales bacterium]|nr:LptF/LptG family permease [Bacteroidales bacterium]MBQ6872644.1 LptF/LptG family permease [Bacteroidales bacterium]MBQ7999564.1 LptF/LptG family permease [Bacteroidales bacterium]MBR4093912.1 LptF/LptG family permease [Bacteroidales bacterium]